MFISIVIPTYNRPHFLAQCLASLAAQLAGKPDTEVHVVDDGSSPENATANRDLCLLHNVNYHYSEKNHGMAVARNTGIACSNGSWIVFVDDDFRVADDWHQTLVPLLQRQDGSVVGVEGKVVPAGNGLWDREVQNLNGGLFITCHIAFRKSLFDAIGGFDPQFEFEGPFCEDHELAVRALRRGAIVFAPELSGVHLPRRIRLWSYTAASFKRVRRLLRADYYFFCKQYDWYHRFRHSRTFWGTYLSLLLRNALNNLRRRRGADCLRHPVQFFFLTVASVLEQIGAWLLVPHFFAAIIRDRPCYFHKCIDERRTAGQWKLSSGISTNDLRFRFAHLHSLFFPLIKKPVYDVRPLLKKLSVFSGLDKCVILLRIDDVFLHEPDNVGLFIKTMRRKNIPYLAGITGDDLTDPSNRSVVEELRESGAEVAIHGFSHKGNFGPFASEVLQMRFPELDEKINAVISSQAFARHPAIAFMPPYNAISGEQIDYLAVRFAIVTGGPETVRFTDHFAGPVAINGGGWYVPTSHPFYGAARDMLQPGLLRQIHGMKGFLCIGLHMTEEAKDGFVSLVNLIDALPFPPTPWRIFTKGQPRTAEHIL
jgi:glycosyltransferase involved in cell wall biosynthesis